MRLDNSSEKRDQRDNFGPIRACIGTDRQFLLTYGRRDIDKAVLSGANSDNIDYFFNTDDREYFKLRKFKYSGSRAYVISPVDDWNKYSLKYINCTGIVVAGREEETGKNISFLSHQSPRSIGELKIYFRKDLEEAITEIKERSRPGTIDAVIFGGNYFLNDVEHRREYIEAVKLLNVRVRKILGLEPLVITGPKTVLGGKTDDIFYKNDERILFIRRENISNASTESYYPRSINVQRKKWK